jgi:hypothetical protein
MRRLAARERLTSNDLEDQKLHKLQHSVEALTRKTSSRQTTDLHLGISL